VLHEFSKFEFPAHASGADDTFDTLALLSISWRHTVAAGGGISLYWVAESIVFSSQAATHSEFPKHRSPRP
jgi:hypothetical protein